MNPFKKIEGIYDASKSVEYDHIGDRAVRPPHVFAVSDSAFATMCANPPGRLANQVPDYLRSDLRSVSSVVNLVLERQSPQSSLSSKSSTSVQKVETVVEKMLEQKVLRKKLCN